MSFETLPVGGRLELTALGTYRDAGELANVWQFQNVTNPVTNEAALLDDMMALIVTIYGLIEAIYHTTVIWNRFRVRYVNEEYVSGVLPLDSPVPGTATGKIGLAGGAALLYFPTGTPRVQLRKYLGALADEVITSANGTLSTGAQADILTLGALLLEPVPAATTQWRYGRAVLPGADFLTPSSAAVSVQPAYQRRRKVGVGV